MNCPVIFPAASDRRTILQGHTILLIEAQIGKVGNDADARQAEAALHGGHAGPEERFIAAELIDDKTSDARAILRLK